MSFPGKSDEITDLKQFRILIDDFPDGEVVPDEEPDFVVFNANQRIGVEHTRLFKAVGNSKYPAQAEENQRNDVLVAARDLYELRGFPPLHVSIFFGKLKPMDSAKRLALAREIACCVVKNMPNPESKTRVEWIPDRSNGLPDNIDHINIHRREAQRFNRWFDPQAGYVLEDAAELIQKSINKKAVRLSDYLIKVDTCWLLLVADGMKPSSMIRPDEASIARQYVSPFERTYFMRSVDADAIRLNTIQPE